MKVIDRQRQHVGLLTNLKGVSVHSRDFSDSASLNRRESDITRFVGFVHSSYVGTVRYGTVQPYVRTYTRTRTSNLTPVTDRHDRQHRQTTRPNSGEHAVTDNRHLGLE